MKVCIMIPALSGGSRLPNKNLLLVDGEPMIHYVLRETKKSIDKNNIYINSDIPEISEIAKKYDVNFFERKKEKGGVACKMKNKSANCAGNRCQVHDHYIYDFLSKVKCDYLVQVHTTSPLLTSETIDGFVEMLTQGNYDSCFSIVKNYKEVMYGNKPVNFNLSKKSPTQNLSEVSELSWALSGWKVSSFKKSYETDDLNDPGPTYLGNMGFYPISKLEGLDVDTYEDLFMVEACLSHLKRKDNCGKRFYNKKTISIERDLDSLILKDGCKTAKNTTYNLSKNNIEKAKQIMGTGSWCYPVVITDNDQACFIQQVPGEGCRWHNHPTKDEFWIVMQGEFLFEIEGVDPILANSGDVIFAEKGKNHRITCVGKKPGIRLACGERNFAHVYEDSEPEKNT